MDDADGDEQEHFVCSLISPGNAHLGLREHVGPDWCLRSSWTTNPRQLCDLVKEVARRLNGPARLNSSRRKYNDYPLYRHEPCSQHLEMLRQIDAVHNDIVPGMKLAFSWYLGLAKVVHY